MIMLPNRTIPRGSKLSCLNHRATLTLDANILNLRMTIHSNGCCQGQPRENQVADGEPFGSEGNHLSNTHQLI